MESNCEWLKIYESVKNSGPPFAYTVKSKNDMVIYKHAIHTQG